MGGRRDGRYDRRVMDQRAAPATTIVEPARQSEPELVSAVRGDIRETLRVAWLHPGIEAAVAQPVFLAAAWSSIRPNVGRTFDRLAADVRASAVQAIRGVGAVPALRACAERARPPADVERIVTAVTAAQFAAARNQVALHLLACAARGESVGGTGEEEPPGRRGTPEWQLWMSAPHPIRLPSVRLDQAERAMGTPTAPTVLRLLSQWPDVLEETWAALRPLVADEAWGRAAVRLRSVVQAGAQRLPHDGLAAVARVAPARLHGSGPGGAGAGAHGARPCDAGQHPDIGVRVARVRRARSGVGSVHAEFHREDDADTVVGAARWTPDGVEIEAEDPKVRRAIGRVYRETNVVIDDPAFRSFGTSGPEVLAPGGLRWFLAATKARSVAEKLGFRLAPNRGRRMGWDPAGAYQLFPDQVERAERTASAGD